MRVSSFDQNPELQLENFPFDRIFTDKVSGKDILRPQLEELFTFVRDGGTVVVHSMDRLARNLDDLRCIVKTPTERGVRIEFVKESLTFTGDDSPVATLMLSVMGAFAEFERAFIRERQREGIMLAQQRSWKVRSVFFVGVIGLLLGAMALVGFKLVTVKMLPFDNKNEFQIIVDMPTGTTPEHTAAATRALGDFAATIPEVENYQLVVGAASPDNSNGLVRHYYLRNQPYQADIQVNLIGKGERKAQSHAIAKRIRPDIERIAKQWGVRFKISEVLPGPPMLQTAAAVIVGSSVILFDPIFQGLAISLMAGEVASLLLSRMTVPITYYLTHRSNQGAV